jgi:hypothetical protein
MTHRWLVVSFLILLAACAPEDLDVTPSPTPTQEPTARPTLEPGVEETEAPGANAASQTQLDDILASMPQTITTTNANWRSDGAAPFYLEVEGGAAGRVGYIDASGNVAEITFGVFDTPEAAQDFYDVVAGRTLTLAQAETRDNYPQPNLFGGSAYGSDAIFVQGSLYIRVNVPSFATNTQGDPLGPLSRQLFSLLESTGALPAS